MDFSLFTVRLFLIIAPVAQLAARRTHNPKVAGSTPAGGTFYLNKSSCGAVGSASVL